MEKFDLNEFSQEVHENAVEHGWWEEERPFDEIIALCHSELSEALEEYRNDRPYIWFACVPTDVFAGCNNMVHCKNKMGKLGCNDLKTQCQYKDKKPEGIAVELADCIIRILDYCGKENIIIKDIVRNNFISFTKLIVECHCNLSTAYKREDCLQIYFENCIGDIIDWCEENNIDIYAILKLKHEYNKTRPYKHGGKII